MEVLKAMVLWTVLFTFVLINTLIIKVVFDPAALGHWEVQRDVAYDSIWMEWGADCDCTEPLE